MPSSSNPSTSVSAALAPVPGFVFSNPVGDVGLQSHIDDAVGAHPAAAISIPATYPASTEDLIYPDGPIEGSSVLDFIGQYKDARPVPPPTLGKTSTATSFSSVPNWDVLEYLPEFTFGIQKAMTGAWSLGSDVQFTKAITPQTPMDLRYSFYPADRGVVALYFSVDGDFLSNSSLVYALWLGPTSERPAGLVTIPSADFDPTARSGLQGQFADLTYILDYRYPRLHEYPGGSPYPNFGEDFPYHQVANMRHSGGGIALSTTPPNFAGSYLLVHWKESFPTVLADIDGTTLNANLIAANCYSAVPSGGNFDSGDIATLNRKKIFVDSYYNAPVTVLTNAANGHGAASTTYLSGVEFYNDDVSATVILGFQDLFGSGGNHRGYLTGKVASPPDVPVGYETYEDPVTFIPVVGPEQGVPYYSLQKIFDSSFLGASNAPSPTDDVESDTTRIVASGTGTVPLIGYGQQKVRVNFTHNLPTLSVGGPKVLYHKPNPGLAGTSKIETFLTETYRYANLVNLAANNKPVVPAGGDVWDSTLAFIVDGTGSGSLAEETGLQVSPGNLRYPAFNYSTSTRPTGMPDYSVVFSGDAIPPVLAAKQRTYIRAFDTEQPTSYGRLRVVGFNLQHFGTGSSGAGTIPDLKPGRVRIRIRVPGTTDWLDLGTQFSVSGGCLIGEKFLGSYRGMGNITGSNTLRANTVTADFEGFIEAGDTVMVMDGASRGIYTVNSVLGREIYIETDGANPYGTFSVENNVTFEVYKGSKVLGTEYLFCTDKSTVSGPTADNGFGEFPLFVAVDIFKFTGDTETFELGLLEMEWRPLCRRTFTK